MRNKLLLSFFILIFSWLTCLNTAYAAANSGDPVSLLKYIADNMISGLKTNKATLKSNPTVVYNLAYRFVVPYADLTEMSKRVLPPQVWNNATQAQREQFQKEFTKTVIRTYASGLTNYQDQTVKFYPPRGGSPTTLEVNSEIDGTSSQPINVTYRLVKNGADWKLYDMSVEGVDMLESFREQFSDILAQGDMDSLLQRLTGHNNR